MPDFPNLVTTYLATPSEDPAYNGRAEAVLTAASKKLGALESQVLPLLETALRTELSLLEPGGELDIETGASGTIVSAWNHLSVIAALHGGRNEAQALAEELLSVIREEQARLGHLHKGTPLHQLGWLHLAAGEESLGQPFFFAALTEDIRRSPENYRAGAAASVLEHRFQREESFFAAVETAIDELLGDGNPLSTIADFDPDLLALASGMTSSVGSNPLRFSLPFDSSIGTFLRAWQEGANTNDEKGDRFEVLVAYLLRTLGGYESRGQVQTLDGENDLLLRDVSDRPSVLGEYVLVECKNWADPVGAPALKKFAQDVRSASCHSGIFVARSGITGTDHRDARYAVRKSYHRDGVVIMVLDDRDVQRVLMREVDLPDFLRSRYEQIRFDEPT